MMQNNTVLNKCAVLMQFTFKQMRFSGTPRLTEYSLLPIPVLFKFSIYTTYYCFSNSKNILLIEHPINFTLMIFMEVITPTCVCIYYFTIISDVISNFTQEKQ